MTSTNPQRWARGLQHLLWKRPGLPRDWVAVLERQPEGVEGLPGYLWLDMPGKVRSVDPSLLELAEEPPASAGEVPR